MNYISCAVAIAPLRKEASHRSEMVSQLLAGETAEILETEKQFTRVRCSHDGYEGWIANNQLQPAAQPAIAIKPVAGFDEDGLRKVAMKFLDVPYLWGGRSNCGIDCSGFSQRVFRDCGISLPRDAYQQAELGEVVGFLQEAVCGDLAFFDNEEGRITHVGIMLASDSIIHAAGKVRIDPIDQFGIIQRESGTRTHKLRIIKRHKKP